MFEVAQYLMSIIVRRAFAHFLKKVMTDNDVVLVFI